MALQAAAACLQLDKAALQLHARTGAAADCLRLAEALLLLLQVPALLLVAPLRWYRTLSTGRQSGVRRCVTMRQRLTCIFRCGPPNGMPLLPQ